MQNVKKTKVPTLVAHNGQRKTDRNLNRVESTGCMKRAIPALTSTATRKAQHGASMATATRESTPPATVSDGAGPARHHDGTIVDSTPLLDGYRMPAEWEPHERTWMLWPTRPDNWGNGARPAQKAFAEVANAIGRFEPVTVGVPPGHEHSARAQLDPTTLTVVVMEQDDAWMRDTGPLFVVKDNPDCAVERHVRGVDWDFNSWGGLSGGCFSSWEKDEAVAGKVLQLAGAERYKARMILEGGSVHVDGEGTVITTEECLLNPNRNPDLAKVEIEAFLREFLGVKLVLWLGKGVFGDTDTDGHVDNLLAFVRPGEVVLHWTDDVADPQHAISSDALHRLENVVDARGRRLKVHKCPLPGPLYASPDEVSTLEATPGSRERARGDRLAASYVNFYLANGAVILPGYGVPEDEEAMRLFKSLFPEREVVQLSTREVALGGGNIHCITQQQPLGVTGVQSYGKPA